MDTFNIPPPDGGWGWVVCFSSFSINVISFGIYMTFGVLLEPLMDHFNASHSEISLVSSFMGGAYMLSMVFIGGLINKVRLFDVHQLSDQKL